MNTPLRIGTRGSPLAVTMAEMLIGALRHHNPSLEAEVVKIVTSGDRSQAANVPLAETGGKGLFIKEIEEALVADEIDCAVHSMKDMPTSLPDGLEIACLLPRGDVRDAFFSRTGVALDDLPQGAIVGTSSLRRQAILLSRRPDLKAVVFRGNVDKRLQKLQEGVVDATLLAYTGLERLGRKDIVQHVLPVDVMLPAVAQGAIGIEVKRENVALKKLLSSVHCAVTELRVTAERAFLAVMDGSCRMPLAALMSAPDADGVVSFDVLVARPDGTDVKKASYREVVTTLSAARDLGMRAGHELKSTLPDGYFL